MYEQVCRLYQLTKLARFGPLQMKPGPLDEKARPVPRCRFVSPARLGPARSGPARRAARPVQVSTEDYPPFRAPKTISPL